MLEKAKNRKIFYFLVFIVLGVSLCVPSISAVTNYSYSTGYVYFIQSDYSWDELHHASAAETVSVNPPATAGGAWIYAKGTNNIYQRFARAVLVFDTSAMTDDYIQKGVKLYIREYNPFDDTWASAHDSNLSIVACDKVMGNDVNDFNNFVFDTSYSDGVIHEAGTKDYIDISSDFPFNEDGLTYIGIIWNADRTDTISWSASAATQYTFYMSGDAPYLSVDSEEPSKDCVITTDKSNGNLPLEVTFTDASDGFSESAPYDDYILSFGDGSYWTGEWQYSGENWFHTYHYAGTYNYSYMITHDGTPYYSNGTITVNDSLSNYYVEVHGLNTASIEGANVSIWYNGEYQDSEGSSSIGRAYFTIPPYRFVNGTVTKPGYQTAYFDTYIYPDDNWETVTLYADNETPGSGDSYGNYIVSFKDASNGNSVGYSNIEVYSDSGYTTLFYDEYSNSGGVWTGLMPMNVTYYYKYPETTGYYSQSWSYNLTVSPAYKTVNLVPKSTATSTPTPTPTVTATTITPTVTYTFNDGNLSSLNVKERFTNLLVLAGFQNAESADLIFAMIIVLGCTALIGWITLSGSGAGMGAIIGFVFSLGLGLIPLWLLIAAIFFGCLYVALKLFGGSGE